MSHDVFNAKMIFELIPSNLELPTDEELTTLKVGDLVQLCLKSKMLWVNLTEINDRRLKGEVNKERHYNDLEVRAEEEVSFTMNHIFAIEKVQNTALD